MSEEEAREEFGAFPWEEKFKHVFDEKGGFDVIAGNPPWGADMEGYEEWLEHEKYGYELAVALS